MCRSIESCIVGTGHLQALPHTTVGLLLCSAALSVTAVTPGAPPNGGAGLQPLQIGIYEGWNFNSGNYLFTTDTK